MDASGKKFEMRTNVPIQNERQCQEIANWLNSEYKTSMNTSNSGYVSLTATCDRFYNT